MANQKADHLSSWGSALFFMHRQGLGDLRSSTTGGSAPVDDNANSNSHCPVHCSFLFLVGAEGFEPSAFCSRSKRATRLRYAPTHKLPHAEKWRVLYAFILEVSTATRHFQKLQNRGRDALVASDGRGNYLTQRRRERRGGVWEQSASTPIVLSGSDFPAFCRRWPGEPRRVTPSSKTARTRG